jgi:peptidoglycan hydrolase-like protein with peptidoglycan-binding domain
MTKKTPSIGRGAFGDLVAVLQSGLATLGHYTRKVDGDFGGGTESAVRSLQLELRTPVSGRADMHTWQSATALPWPDLFQRCLQLTARFEGHGYTLIVGNFDGAGLTWGIVGFTLQHGELQVIINELVVRAPELLEAAFGVDGSRELADRLRTQKPAALIRWADSISSGSGKQIVIEPWRSGFAALGAQPFVQELQRRRAREKYFEPAMSTATRLGLDSERGVALCFDIHVQNGGVKKTDEKAYFDAIESRRSPSAKSRREILARLVADSARKQYRDDVFARKNAIASGSGISHGQLFDLDEWGFDAP